MGHTVCVLQCYKSEGVGCRTGWPCNIVWTRWPHMGIIITITITTTTKNAAKPKVDLEHCASCGNHRDVRQRQHHH